MKRGNYGVRRATAVVALTLLWCGLWGAVSPANVAGGAAISIALVAVGAGPPLRGRIAPLPLAQLLALVTVDLVRSTIAVAVEILTPTDRTDEAIIAVPVSREARDHLLLLIVAITLTPGTAVVDADPDGGVLYLHLLHHDRKQATVDHVSKLVRLADRALPAPRGSLR